MKTSFPIYAVAAGIFLVGLLITIIRVRRLVTPFHFCLFFLGVQSALAAFPLLKTDAYGRTHYDEPLSGTVLILITSSIAMCVMSFFLRRPGRISLTDFRIQSHLPKTGIALLLFGIVVGSSVLSLLRLKTFPLFAMATLDPSDGNAYEYAYSGFATYIGWGAARALSIWAILEVALSPTFNFAVFRKNFVLYASAIVALGLNVLDGQRNALVLIGLNAFFVGSLRGWFKLRHFAVLAVVGLVYFVVVGSFRAGTSVNVTEYLENPTGNATVDSTFAWLVTYLEPNMHNLNNLVALDPEPAYGFKYLTDIVPDQIFEALNLEIPESSVELLANSRMFAQPGLTFRTAFADFYRDFGALGSTICVLIIYGFGILTYNRSASRPGPLLVFLMLAPGIVYIPFMNLTRGIVPLFPLILFALLRFQRVAGASISPGRNQGRRPGRKVDKPLSPEGLRPAHGSSAPQTVQ